MNIVGSVTIKKGNIFIKNDLNLGKNVTVLLGNFTMAKGNTITGDIQCKGGVVRMGMDNVVHGDVYAMDLRQGANNEIKGKFHKIEK